MDFNLLFVVILVGFAAAVGFTVFKNLSRMSNLLQTSSYWRELGKKFNLTYEAQPSEHIERLIGSHRACPLALTGKGDPLSEAYEVVAEIDLHTTVTPKMTLAAEPEDGASPTVDTVRIEGPSQAHELLLASSLRAAWDELAAQTRTIELREGRLCITRLGPLSDEAILEDFAELAVGLALVIDGEAAKFPTLRPEDAPRTPAHAPSRASNLPVAGELHTKSTNAMKGDFFKEKAGFPVGSDWDRSGERKAAEAPHDAKPEPSGKTE